MMRLIRTFGLFVGEHVHRLLREPLGLRLVVLGEVLLRQPQALECLVAVWFHPDRLKKFFLLSKLGALKKAASSIPRMRVPRSNPWWQSAKRLWLSTLQRRRESRFCSCPRWSRSGNFFTKIRLLLLLLSNQKRGRCKLRKSFRSVFGKSSGIC